MVTERGPQNTHLPQIDVLIKNNLKWVDGMWQFTGNGHPFEELVGPSLEYALSLCRPEDRDAMRASYQNRLEKIKSPKEKALFIASDIVAHWHRNMP